MTAEKSVSQQLLDSGVVTALVGTLTHSGSTYTFSVYRDSYGKLWLRAVHGLRISSIGLNQPPRESGFLAERRFVLTSLQWELVNRVATES